MNQATTGKQNNPIYINSSDDEESDIPKDNSQDDDFNFLFERDNRHQLALLNDNFQNNHNHGFQQAINVQMYENPIAQLPIHHPLPPLPPPPPPPPLQLQVPQQEEPRRFGFGTGLRAIFGNLLGIQQAQPRNEPILRNRNNFNLFHIMDAPQPPPPPQPDKIKRKKIKLNGIDFSIIDVPHKIFASLKKGCDVSPSFDMAKASTYIQMVLQHGQIPDDFLDRLVVAACDPKTSSTNAFNRNSDIVLRNLLPEYKVGDIKKAFKAKKQMIVNTLDSIKQNTTFKKLTKVRVPDKYIIIDDPIVSVQLDELFLEYEKERKKKEKEEEEENQIRQAEIDGSLIECECCICEYPIDWMIQCPEGHLMCKKCVEKQIETAISEGRSNVPCLKFGGCDQQISMAELNRLIPKKTLERLVATETLNAITSAEIENRVTCHKCGFIVIYDGNGPMNCPQCKAQTCPKCGGAWHPNMTCEQFKEIDKDRIVEEQMNEAVVRTCPKCKTQFMKDEGCNKMECPRCHTWICYWCRKVIPKEVGYEHFWRQAGPCPPDKCPLWVQNDTLHLIEAEKAKDHANDELKSGKLNSGDDEEEDDEI